MTSQSRHPVFPHIQTLGISEFLDAIESEPDDDTRRHAFADWLGRYGEDDLAEFVRLQLQLAASQLFPQARDELKCRERDLLSQYSTRWLGDLTSLAPVANWQFCRGMPENLHYHAQQLQVADTYRLARSPHLQRVRFLCLDRTHIGNAGIAAIADSSYVARVETLNLSSNHISHPGACSLSESTQLACLKSLNLSRNNIAQAGIREMTRTTFFANVQHLILDSNRIGAGGAYLLAICPHLANLKTLSLIFSNIGDEGLESLAMSSHLHNLSSFRVNGSNIGNAGARAILRSSRLPKLQQLWIGHSKLATSTRADLIQRFGSGVHFI